MKQVMPGGSGMPGPLLFLVAVGGSAVVAFYAFTFRVNPDELGVVMRFGKPCARSRRACTSACPIRSRRCACPR